jgi:hypothetical protein
LLTTFFACTVSAPHFSIRYRTMSKCPLADAKCRSVLPICNGNLTVRKVLVCVEQLINQSNSRTLAFTFISVPRSSIRYRTTSKCPLEEAKWRGVSSYCNVHFNTCQTSNVRGTINQIHSHNPSRSHQLHISQSDIAPLPNARWMMHREEPCHHTATFISTHLPLLSEAQ